MPHEDVLQARILVVDDEVANIQLLRRVLEPSGFENIRDTSDPGEVLDLVDEYDPDLILLDLLMPVMDGFEILRELRGRTPEDVFLPILVLTSDHSPTAKRRALSEGAKDFLTKPLSPAEVRLRVKNLLQTRFLHRTHRRQNELLADQNLLLEHRVQERTQALEEARLDVLLRLARAAEYRDDETGEHTKRVGRTSALVARAMDLGDPDADLLEMVAPLHDVGKIGVPDSILLSPASLSPEEFEVMKRHTVIGGDLLGGSEFSLLDEAARIARTHHERWDGKGYPLGLAGEDIPLSGRIVAVVDTFDALTHNRPYKRAWGLGESLEEMRFQSGRQFDPQVVEAFLCVVDRLKEDESAA